jgi:hypothetical protein
MKDKIIDYLTIKAMRREELKNKNSKVRCAWIIAKKEYLKLSEEEKQEIIKKIGADEGT